MPSGALGRAGAARRQRAWAGWGCTVVGGCPVGTGSSRSVPAGVPAGAGGGARGSSPRQGRCWDTGGPISAHQLSRAPAPLPYMVRAVRGAPRASPYKGMNLNTAPTLGRGGASRGRGLAWAGPGRAPLPPHRARSRRCRRARPARGNRRRLLMQMSSVSPLIAFVKSGLAGLRPSGRRRWEREGTGRDGAGTELDWVKDGNSGSPGRLDSHFVSFVTSRLSSPRGGAVATALCPALAGPSRGRCPPVTFPWPCRAHPSFCRPCAFSSRRDGDAPARPSAGIPQNIPISSPHAVFEPVPPSPHPQTVRVYVPTNNEQIQNPREQKTFCAERSEPGAGDKRRPPAHRPRERGSPRPGGSRRGADLPRRG